MVTVAVPITAAEDWLGQALKAVADPTRLRILSLLRQREQCVCHLTGALGLNQATISHHMGVLKRAGLVRCRRDDSDARWTYYTIDEKAAARLALEVEELLDTSGMDRSPAHCRDIGSTTVISSDTGKEKCQTCRKP